jgi:hypothetical protein
MQRYPAAGAVEYDPALVAFVKCHVSSVVRWDLLWYLAQHVGLWLDAPTVSRALNKPQSQVDSALRELADEGLVETTGRDAQLPRYTMQPEEPTTRVVQRLVEAAQHSSELRRLIVARVAA